MTPVAAWFTYSLVVGLLVSLSALLGEAALRAGGAPIRWAWVGGIVATVALPVAAILGSLGWAEPVSLAPVAVIPLAPLAVNFEPSGSGISVDTWLLAGWAALAVACLSHLFRMHRYVVRGGAEGHPARVAGVGVLVTRRLGPAVFGMRRAKILVPEWTLGLDVRLRRLMLLHEGEHARAGDGQLVLGALVLAAAVPWNLPLWYQLSRLRAAVELDCDARVLRRIPDRSGYGGLLLEVGRRGSERLLGVAMAERRTRLEHRLCRITEVARRPDVRRALWLAGVAGLLLAVAAFTRDPNTGSGQPGVSVAIAVQDTSILARGPAFTPFTQAPRLTNPDEVTKALEAAYPRLLRDAGIGGDAMVWFLIGEDGRVRKTQINESSGYPVLDEAALKVAAIMKFTPALNRDRVVPVWVSIPIRFTTGAETADVSPTESGKRAQIPPKPEQGRAAPGQDLVIPPMPAEVRAGLRQEVVAGDGPVFTPFTVAPRLVNQAEVARALERNYPPLLRDAAIGGEVRVWFFIDEDGRVLNTQIGESSGYPALDEAAEGVARTMRFTPAMNRDREVPVWVSIPIKFNTK